MAQCETFWWQGVKGILLDVTGVLYEPGENGGKVIEGSVNAVQRYVKRSTNS